MTSDNKLKISTTEWNDSLGYLQTIDWLLRTAHIQSMDDDDVYDWFMVLEQLSIEVSGQYMSPAEQSVVAEIETVRKTTLKNYRDLQQKLKNSQYDKNERLMRYREVIRPFHLLINKYAHLKGLRMQDKKNINIEDMV